MFSGRKGHCQDTQQVTAVTAGPGSFLPGARYKETCRYPSWLSQGIHPAECCPRTDLSELVSSNLQSLWLNICQYPDSNPQVGNYSKSASRTRMQLMFITPTTLEVQQPNQWQHEQQRGEINPSATGPNWFWVDAYRQEIWLDPYLLLPCSMTSQPHFLLHNLQKKTAARSSLPFILSAS